VTGDLIATRVAFLSRQENFVEKFSATLGFLSGVIAFLFGLIVTMTWLHFLIPLGLNVDVSSFLLMLSFMIIAATLIVAPVVLKNGLPRISDI
jgi:tellurite resistance protein TehA-like permease